VTIETKPENSQIKVYEWVPFEGNKGDVIAEGESPLKISEETIRKNRGIVIIVTTKEKDYFDSEQVLFAPYKFSLNRFEIQLQKKIKEESVKKEIEDTVPSERIREFKRIQPETTPPPAPPVLDSDETVFITKSGYKYHCGGCSYLKKSSIPIKKKDAINRGYGPCSRCNP